MLDSVDFASGLKQRDILLHLLEHHIDELDPGHGYGKDGCQDFSDQLMTYTYVMNEAFPFPVRCLQTGSVPENVCLPDNADTDNGLFAFKRYPEGDLMVVIKMKYLTQVTPVVQDIPQSPGFVRIVIQDVGKTRDYTNEAAWDHSVASDAEFQADICESIDSCDFKFLLLDIQNETILSAKRFVDMFYIILNCHFTSLFQIWKSSFEEFPREVLENEGFIISRHGPALDMVLKSKFHNFSLCALPSEGVSIYDSEEEDRQTNNENSVEDVPNEELTVKHESKSTSNIVKQCDNEYILNDEPEDLDCTLSDQKKLVSREVIRLVGKRTMAASPDPSEDAESNNNEDPNLDSVIVVDGGNDDDLPSCDYDVVPAIRLPEWPAVAHEWITRHRLWPSKDTVKAIVDKGILVVGKPPKGGNHLTDWRLSFSEAEVMLISSKEFPCRQQAYRIFKYAVKTSLSNISVICSYHLKTILLWVSEKLPPNVWEWENLSYCYLGELQLQNLYPALNYLYILSYI